jgi:hypothetical protein
MRKQPVRGISKDCVFQASRTVITLLREIQCFYYSPLSPLVGQDLARRKRSHMMSNHFRSKTDQRIQAVGRGTFLMDMPQK